MPPQQEGTKAVWKISRNDQPRPIIIAEPKHRSGAVGLSSGISLRQIPKSTIQKVREICVHYVEKCSGKYDDNKVAARYVYQLADEVINQLAGVAAQLRQIRANSPENFQELLDEWNEEFPQSLGASGTPKNIALKLERQSQELEQLHDELARERNKQSEEVSRIISSTNAQLYASGQGMISERRQLLAMQQQKNKELELRLAAAKTEADAAIQCLQANNEGRVKKMQEDRDRDIVKLSKHCENLRNELEISQAARKSDKDTADKILAMEKDSHVRSMDKLQKEISAVSILASDGDKSFGRGLSPKSNYPLSSRDSARKGRRTPRPEDNYDERRIGDLRKIEGLTAVIDTLIAQVESAHKERSNYQSRVDELTVLNEALRKALSLRLYNRVDYSGTTAARSLSLE